MWKQFRNARQSSESTDSGQRGGAFPSIPTQLLRCWGEDRGQLGFTRGGVCQVSRAEEAKTKGLKMNAKNPQIY